MRASQSLPDGNQAETQSDIDSIISAIKIKVGRRLANTYYPSQIAELWIDKLKDEFANILTAKRRIRKIIQECGKMHLHQKQKELVEEIKKQLE